NIVWQTDSIDDFMPYVKPYCDYAKAQGRKLVYFRFASHPEFVSLDSGAEIVYLKPEEGFEKFITVMHEVIGRIGDGGYYIFDSLSELAVEHFSESMIENFFFLTCPRLLKMKCIAYFMVLRNYNSYHATQLITRTTQLVLDTYSNQGKQYIHPVKVDGRYSPTMYMLHERKENDFVPVMDSTVISEVSVSGPWYGLQSAPYRAVGLWDKLFIEAENIIGSCKRGECSEETVQEVFRRQLKQVIATDERMVSMVQKHMDLPGLIHIWKRMIGSGMIGGKSVGMLLAHDILKKEFSRYDEIMEKHDSFYIGSDIFYSFLVQNGCWHTRQKQKDQETLFDGIEEAREHILSGSFPEEVIKRFSDMLDYFGQAPIIVRSSSLLEDNFGNAFSGKYDSIFCVNNGTREDRLKKFLDAVRIIYASTMNREALAYRARRNVLENDEQMALLVQRVSGSRYKNIFMPELAGVGVSYNSYTWDETIDPEAGLLRLVFGLGTRAVDRHDDDYTRIVALNEPEKRPEGNSREVLKFTQKRVDVLDLAKNAEQTLYFTDIIKENPDLRVDLFSTEVEQNGATHKVIDFNAVFSETTFIKDMREILTILKVAYGNQVDIEFTANFLPNGKYRINLLQCRPQNVIRDGSSIKAIPDIDSEHMILKASGGIVGRSRNAVIDRIIYVVPAIYGKLPEQDRYAIARLVGKLAHHHDKDEHKTIMLLGPGRWCTKMPSLGVPVNFSEINTASVICEIGAMHEGLTPDLSMGTHFFNDMVEMDILYMGVFVTKKENIINEELLLKLPDRFLEILPEEKKWKGAIRLIEGSDIPDNGKIYLNADSVKQVSAVYIAQS
ncbi:MAG: PEP/pyruvate-binding domain-containing protein, partial [bacterium]